jgi:disulfide bond formation protein DsbB
MTHPLDRLWDARVERGLALLPCFVQRMVAAVRKPSRRWLRILLGAALSIGGVLSILPILGLWTLPLGLGMIAEDIPPMKRWLERTAQAIERRWLNLKSWWQKE